MPSLTYQWVKIRVFSLLILKIDVYSVWSNVFYGNKLHLNLCSAYDALLPISVPIVKALMGSKLIGITVFHHLCACLYSAKPKT